MAQNLALNIEITALTNKAIKGLTNLDKSVTGVGKRFESLGKSLTSVIGTAAVGGFFAKIVKDASDAEETINKFNVVFQDVAGSASKAARDLARDFGLSQNAAKTLLSDTGDLLTGFGFTGEAALELSSNVQELAVDLASFTNFSGGAEGASAALTKALLGETESLKSLGIAINQDLVKKKVQELATQGLTFETEKQAKAQATYLLALEQSKNAIGDFARSSNSFANQLRIARANLSDLSAQLGAILLPIATKVVAKISEIVAAFTNLETITKVYILATVALAASIGPLLIIFGKLLQVVGFAVGAFKSLLGVVLSLISPLGLIVAGVTALVSALGVAAVRFINLKNAGVDSFGAIKIIVLDLADLINTVLVKSLQGFINLALRAGNVIREALGQEAAPLLDIDGFGPQIQQLKNEVLSAFNVEESDISPVKDTIVNTLGGAVDSVKAKFKEFSDQIAGGISIPTEGIDRVTQGITAAKKESIELNKELKSTGPNLLASGLSDALINVADGSKKASESFTEFANNFLRRITRMITESLILQAVQSSLGLASDGQKIIKVSGGSTFTPQGFATGGQVSGPGTGTSDSILARLSNGEFVSDAKTVSHFGPSFFDNLKRMARGGIGRAKASFKGGLPAFASGGMVGTSGSDFIGRQTEPMSVNIQNSGTEKEATQVTTERTAAGTVVNIVLEDFAKNGPISRGMSSTFGSKRGARK